MIISITLKRPSIKKNIYCFKPMQYEHLKWIWLGCLCCWLKKTGQLEWVKLWVFLASCWNYLMAPVCHDWQWLSISLIEKKNRNENREQTRANSSLYLSYAMHLAVGASEVYEGSHYLSSPNWSLVRLFLVKVLVK